MMIKIKEFLADDIRFPTSIQGDGSDAVNTDPDYSCVYVRIKIDNSNNNDELIGHGLTFTIGRGTEIVLQAVLSLKPIIMDVNLMDLFKKIGAWRDFYRKLTNDSQLRWIGPEKGVIHLAVAAIINSIWDLWAKIEKKPLWKLLVDMEPEFLIGCIDFRYITDVLTEKEALEILKAKHSTKNQREIQIRKEGYPAYTTGIGWINYSDEYRRKLCRKALEDGYTRFKIKVGTKLEDDHHRLKIIRDEIGYDNSQIKLMVDANQKWEVDEAIEIMKQLSIYKILWIEEPTNPDDIFGHKRIAEELSSYGIKVATGEQCHNRIMFKQFLSNNAMQFCQIDSCRLGGVNEVLSVILMASKLNIPVCPHAGGIGLCEYVQHLAIWDFISVSGRNDDDRMIEYQPHLVEHFQKPAKCLKGNYQVPEHIGYCCQLKSESIEKYRFPNGSYWKQRRQQQ